MRGVEESWVHMGVELLIGQGWGNRSLVKQRLVLALLQGNWQAIYKLCKLFLIFGSILFA